MCCLLLCLVYCSFFFFFINLVYSCKPSIIQTADSCTLLVNIELGDFYSGRCSWALCYRWTVLPMCVWLTVVCIFWKVIEEIEEMMQESPDPEDDETPTQSDRLSMLSQEIQTLKRSSTSSYEESKEPYLSWRCLCVRVSQPESVTTFRNLWFSQAGLHTLPLLTPRRWYSGHLFLFAWGLCHIYLWILYLSAWAAVAKNRRLGGLNHRNLLLASSGG